MLRVIAALLLVVCPAAALAGERTLLLKTMEDESTPADLKVCDAAKFAAPVNVVLGASVWSLQTRAARGEVNNEAVRFLGTATGCGLMTDPRPYAPGQRFLVQFELDDGVYVADGTCDIVSATVPTAGLMLAGCALRVVKAPEGVLGGIATSASIFNPMNVPGFGTGSVWTLHLYTAD